jgi:hypothetical protein
MSTKYIGCGYYTISADGTVSPLMLVPVIQSDTGNSYTLPPIEAGSTAVIKGVLTDNTLSTSDTYHWTIASSNQAVTDLGYNRSDSDVVTLTEYDATFSGTIKLEMVTDPNNITVIDSFTFSLGTPNVINYTSADTGKVFELTTSDANNIDVTGLDNTFSISFVAIGQPRTISSSVKIDGFYPNSSLNTITLPKSGDSVTLMYNVQKGTLQVVHKSTAFKNDICYIQMKVPEQVSINAQQQPIPFPAYVVDSASEWLGPSYLHPAGSIVTVPDPMGITPPELHFVPLNAGLYQLQFEMSVIVHPIGSPLGLEILVEGDGKSMIHQLYLIPANPQDSYFNHSKYVSMTLVLQPTRYKISLRNSSVESDCIITNDTKFTAVRLI